MNRKQFLEKLPSDIQIRKSRKCKIPPHVAREIEKEYRAMKTECININEYLTALCVFGRDVLINKPVDLNNFCIDSKFGTKYQKPRTRHIKIDGNAFGVSGLRQLSAFVGVDGMVCVKEVMSLCVLIGHANGGTKCIARAGQRIYL